jgi:hypothetical protein
MPSRGRICKMKRKCFSPTFGLLLFVTLSWTLSILFLTNVSVKESTAELLNKLDFEFLSAQPEVSPIGLRQDDPRLIKYIQDSFLVHPEHDQVVFKVINTFLFNYYCLELNV